MMTYLMYNIFNTDAGKISRVGQRAHNPEAVGSNPTPANPLTLRKSSRKKKTRLLRAGLRHQFQIRAEMMHLKLKLPKHLSANNKKASKQEEISWCYRIAEYLSIFLFKGALVCSLIRRRGR